MPLLPTDDPNTSTLPDPELNPLLNPLLAAHMGRWAEVYFTSPPEKRSQAIAELIRELENAPSEPVAPPVVEGHNAQKEDTQSAETLRNCSACGYGNAAEQKFCGMCGAMLGTPPAAHVPRDLEPREASWSEPEPAGSGDSAFYPIDPALSATSAAGIPDFGEPDGGPAENQIPHFAMEAEPASSPYRLYVGVVLVVLIGLLVYMAWRGTTAISSTSGPQPFPSKVIPPAPGPTEDTVQQPGSQPSGLPASSVPTSTPAAAQPNQKQPETNQRQRQSADSRPASSLVTKAASNTPLALEPSGADDLATAERYLNAGPGRDRDSSEAALWLWKAVGKGNPAATMILSDLYLRGDGVPKNCDQARVLLNAAARKGSKAAGERLRNLQTFGCE
jgi:hypothetical protein